MMAGSEDQDVGVCRTPTILLINPNGLHDLQKREEMKRIFFPGCVSRCASAQPKPPFSFLLLIYDAY